MKNILDADPVTLRHYRNSRLYRSLTRVLREYNRQLVASLQQRGFEDFSSAFPQMLSNLDMEGSRIGVLAARAGISRQAAGQLLVEIERCGYVERRPDPEDARATLVVFTARGKKLLANVVTLVENIEGKFAEQLGTRSFAQMRARLHEIADAIDPDGALGSSDRSGKEPG